MDFQQCKHLGDRGGPSGPRGGLQGDGPQGMRNPDDRLMEKVMLMSGPTYDLPPMDHSEKRFSGRSKLYFGNIANDVEENEIRDLFAKYGETSELFLNKEKNFGFVRMVITIFYLKRLVHKYCILFSDVPGVQGNL